MRSLVRETSVEISDLVYPIFVEEGENIAEPIPSMPNIKRYSIDRIDEELDRVAESGVKSLLIFGIPKHKDECGSEAYNDNGITQQAIRHIKEKYDMLVIADVCLCEYTSHGHCGLIHGTEILNDQTLDLLSKMSVSLAKAGADIIDTDMSPLSMGTAQPATEVMVAALQGTDYDTNLNLSALKEITDYFKPIREDDIKSGLLNTKMLGVDISTLIYQVPGGMLSNLVSQLKNANAEDKYDAVLAEIPKVRADLGYPPLVTPSSQIVGTQAVLNVLMGERYKMVPKETKDIVRGMYGQTPVPISEEIRKKIIGDEEPITCRPADLIEP